MVVVSLAVAGMEAFAVVEAPAAVARMGAVLGGSEGLVAAAEMAVEAS